MENKKRILILLPIFFIVFANIRCAKNLFYGLEPAPKDSEGPNIYLFNPVENQAVAGEMSVIGATTDKYKVVSVGYKIDNGSLFYFSSTSNWKAVVDTTVLSPGEHTLTIVARDDNGNTSTLTRKFFVDQSIPEISLNINFDNYENYVKGQNVLISGKASDENGVAKVQLSFDGGLNYSNAQLANGDWTYTISDTSILMPNDGVINVVVRAIDNSGLIALMYFPLWIDNTSPSGSVSNPEEYSNIKVDSLPGSLLEIKGTCQDNIGVLDIIVNIVGFSTDTVSCSNGQFSLSKNVFSLRNTGAKEIKVTIRDKAKNSYIISIMVTFNENPPYFTGNISTSRGILDSDLDKQANNFPSGTFTISGTVNDNDGNLTTEIASIKIRIERYDTGSVVVDYTDVDNLDNPPIQAGKCSATGNWTHRVDTTTINEGTYVLKFKVVDQLGGIDIVQRVIKIDKANPTLGITSPSNLGSVSGDSVAISGIADSGVSGIYSIRIRIHDGNDPSGVYKVDQTFTAPNFTGIFFKDSSFIYYWNTNSPLFPVSPPNHTILVTVVDLAGNESNSSIDVIKDPNMPQVFIQKYDHPTNPNFKDKSTYNYVYVNGSGIIKGNATDNSSIVSMAVKINNGGWNSISITPGSSVNWEYTLPNLSNGTYQISVKAVDDQSNEVVTVLNIRVDNTVPTVSNFSLSLEDNSNTTYYHGNVIVSGSSSDNVEVISVDVMVDESPTGGEDPEILSTVTTPNFNVTWNTQQYPTLSGSPVIAQDNIRVMIIVTDKAGNFTTDYKDVNVRPYVISVNKTSAYLGETGIIVYGHNFSNTSTVTVGGGNVTVTARDTISNPNSITFTIPSAFPPSDGLSSGPVIVNTNSVSNSSQTPVKMDLFYVGNYASPGGSNVTFPSGRSDGNTVKVAYNYDVNPRQLWYYNGSTNRTVYTGSSTGGVCGYTSLYYSPTIQYIAYREKDSVKIFKSTNEFSTVTTVTSANWTGATTNALEVDSNGYVHFIYYNNSNLYYMISNNGFSTVPSPNTVATGAGAWANIKITSSGTPVIVYYDPTNDSLKFTYATSLNPATGSATFATPRTIFTGAGKYNIGLYIDSSDRIHVSFYETNSGDLYYAVAENITSNFSVELVDSMGITGWFSSIALGSDGTPHIVYYDFTVSKMKYAFKKSGTWKSMFISNETMNVTNNTGVTSIVIASNSFVQMLYASVNQIKRAIYLAED